MVATPSNAKELVGDIERRISEGHLAPGERLLPVRATAEAFGLAPNTVAAAYRTLRERGLIFGEGRRGTFVASVPALARPSSMPEDRPMIEGLIDMSAGHPDPILLPDLEPVLRSLRIEPVSYGMAPVDADLRRLFAAEIGTDLPGRFGPEGLIPDSQMVIVGGALDGIERVLAAHLRAGDRVVVEDPAYTSVLDLVGAMGLRPVPVAIDEYGPIPQSLRQAVKSGVAAAIVTPRAQNPTGAAFDLERAKALADILGTEPELLIVEDDHAGLVAGQPYHSVAGGSQRWALVRSVAKSLGPDLRLAALVGDEVTVSRVGGRQMLGTGWVSHILQRTVVELLEAPDAAARLAEAAATYERRRQRFVARLAAGGVTVHARSGLNVWVPVSDEADVVLGMQQRGFAIRSGSRFRQQAGPAVRVSVAGCPDDQLEPAADALLEAMAAGSDARTV